MILAALMFFPITVGAAEGRLLNLGALSDGDRSALSGVYGVHDQANSSRCFMTLFTETVAGGYAVKVPRACAVEFPLLAGVTAWRLYDNDDIELMGKFGQVLRLRHRTESGSYSLNPRIGGIALVQWTGNWETGD